VFKNRNLRSELAEKVAGIGSVTSASVIGIAHDALHANLIGGFVGINVSLLNKNQFLNSSN
jgi:hypothetical protein